MSHGCNFFKRQTLSKSQHKIKFINRDNNDLVDLSFRLGTLVLELTLTHTKTTMYI